MKWETAKKTANGMNKLLNLQQGLQADTGFKRMMAIFNILGGQ